MNVKSSTVFIANIAKNLSAKRVPSSIIPLSISVDFCNQTFTKLVFTSIHMDKELPPHGQPQDRLPDNVKVCSHQD